MVLRTERLSTDMKPLVTVKGTREGLLFLLDEQAEVEALLTSIEELLQGDRANMFSGPDISVSIDYGMRKLSPGEIGSILQLFLSQANFVVKEWGSHTYARQSLLMNRHRMDSQTIFKGTVRSGQQLVYEGDVVVIGDVNPGGEIQATGDIFVFGRLQGIAHAGMHGDIRAVIGATEFAPMQLRIADVASRAPEIDGRPIHAFMEFAYLCDDGMAVDKMKFYSTIRQRFEER